MNHVKQSNKRSNHLILSALLAHLLLAYSFTSHAFDFKEAIKGAVENELKKSDGSTDTKTTDTKAKTDTQSTTETKVKADDVQTPAASVEAKAEAETGINWQNPTQEEEIAIGREITGSLLGAAPLVKDAALQKYVNTVGRWVASQSDRADLPWHFGVIESEDINAFSAPGGYVVITKGLYRKLNNEAQLAGILGHEIGHVVKKHQLKVIQKQQLLNKGASLLSQKFAKDNKLANKAIGTGAEISARGLDKSAEYEADRLGISVATRAGYDAYGLVDVLQNLTQTSKNDGSVALLFKTHPMPEERLVALSDAVGNKLDNVKAGKTLENRFYKLKN
jgi:predicted Zn-dependent protease